MPAVTVAQAAITTRWELYKLLGEPARLALLGLCSEDELAVSELAELLGESQPNVSRQASPLRQAGLLSVRRQGTWTLMRLAPGVTDDAVVADAVRSGRALCHERGLLERVADVVRAREAGTREFFSRPRGTASLGPAPESTAYLAALASLISSRSLAVDAGTGDGRSLDVLAPLFEHVFAVDRSDAQLALCRERVRARGFSNVTTLLGDLDGAVVRDAVRDKGGADVVLAARVLHHAPRPAETLRQLASLLKPGGAVIVLDYARHDDEAMRDREADLWLGFEPAELADYARGAGLGDVNVTAVPSSWNGTGPDRHLRWQVMVARTLDETMKPASRKTTGPNDSGTNGEHRRAGAQRT